jgi:hypothetical protein
MTHLAAFLLGVAFVLYPKQFAITVASLLGLALLLGTGSLAYRASSQEISNLRRVENGWMAEVSYRWCPFQEPVVWTAFRRDSDKKWRDLADGSVTTGSANGLDHLIRSREQKKIAEEFKNR